MRLGAADAVASTRCRRRRTMRSASRDDAVTTTAMASPDTSPLAARLRVGTGGVGRAGSLAGPRFRA